MKENIGLKEGRAQWTSPGKGWWKANVDAAWENQKAGLAVVGREGKILFLTSKVCLCESPFLAEVKA